MTLTRLLATACGLSVLLVAAPVAAAVAWTGDFETGDASQWNYLLNPEIDGVPYINVVDDMVAEGMYAVRIELHDDAIWPGNMLRRVELQHSPDDARTGEGATNFVAWSFYFPESLPEDSGATIGYWESNNSYQQMMAFDVNGEHITFVTRRPNNVVQWDADGVVTAGAWHRIAMRVLWSEDAGTGEVDVYFDGELVVDAAAAQTKADGNPLFMQVGLLRGNFDFDDVPVIYIDHALEGDSLEDVAFDELPGGGDESGSSGSGEGSGSGGPTDDSGTSGSGGNTTSGPSTSGDPNDDSGTMGATSAATGSDDGTDTVSVPVDEGGDGDDEGGCGCRSDGGGAPWLVLILMAAVRPRHAPSGSRRGTRARALHRDP